MTSRTEEFEGARERLVVWLAESELQLTAIQHFGARRRSTADTRSSQVAKMAELEVN